MFLGTHTPRLDDKGRLFLPAKYRERMAGGLVVTRGQERSLFIYPMDEFVRVADQMRQAPTTSKVARDYMRVFLSGASDEIPDKQAASPSPPTCASTPASTVRSRSSVPARASRSGTAPSGTPTWSRPSRASPTRPRRSFPACSDRPAPPSTSSTDQHHLSAGLQPLRSRDDFPRPGRRSGWGPAPR